MQQYEIGVNLERVGVGRFRLCVEKVQFFKKYRKQSLDTALAQGMPMGCCRVAAVKRPLKPVCKIGAPMIAVFLCSYLQ